MLWFLWMLIMGLVIVVPFWKIFQKAGFNSMLAILMIIPFVNLLTIYYLAFTEWPVFKTKPPQQP